MADSIIRVAVAVLLCLAGGLSAAAQNFPDRPIRFITGFGSGGPTDIVARTLADRLSETTPFKVIVDARPGASGNIATQAVAAAAPDGYTLLVAASPLAVNESLFRDLTVRYGRDLVAVAPIGATANVLVVNPASGIRTLADFTAAARARPGWVNYATLGTGSSSHLAGAAFDLGTGTRMVPVPYRAGADALRDVLAGSVQAWFATIPSVLEAIRSGTLTGLATTGPERSAWLADLPTIAEAAIPGYDVRLWLGLFAPAQVPAERLGALEQAVRRTLDTPEMRRILDVQGVAPLALDRPGFAAFVGAEVVRWKAVVSALNIEAP